MNDLLKVKEALPQLTSQANKLSKDLPYADRRRLEICRAIASDPKVILLDEP